ncbi:MAG: flagellar hook-length control protein FliK [Methylovirgula sp.]|nr:flagellar hook-length control protein FliK [Methylovirgula sp.]
MNNISGFSGALVASNPLLAPEPKTGGDSAAAEKGQSFETLLTGLSQQSETTTTDSSSTADTLTRQGGAASPSPGSDALALVNRATARETSQTVSASQASGTATGQNRATVLSATVSTERLVASAAALDVAGDGAPSQETSTPAQASGRPQGQKAAGITLSTATASKPQPTTVSTQSSGAQTQPNIVSVNASSQQLASAAADTADTASIGFAPLAEVAAASSSSAATSVSQKSTESGQASSPRERRQSTEPDASQTQSQPAVSVTAAALLAAAANVVPVAGAQQTVSADSGPSSSADDSAALGSGGSSLAGEAAVTKVALASHGAASKSDSTEDSTTQTKVDVVSQATYFAPVASLSPAQQIVNAVVPLLSSSDTAGQDSSATSSVQSATPATDISAMLAAAQPSSSAVKTLDLQLEPPDLGTVNVKLNLSDGGLEVEVQTSQSTTRDLLEKDKQELTNRLTGTGYTITGIDVSLAAPSSAASSFADQSAAGQGSSGQTSGGSGQGYSGSQAQDGGANNSPQRQSQRQSGNATFETASSAPRRTAGTGLYL